METKQYCRLCLGQSANLLWVFDQRFEVNNHLKDLIFKTTGVKISQEDTISQKICHKCGDNVVKLYEFRQQSIKNDQFLKEQQNAQKRRPHRSVLNIFQKYPRILIPGLEVCLFEDISPVVEMRMDEVENHFKSKNLDFQKHVVQVLRQEKQKQRAINAALKSKNPSNIPSETVSPISIKFRQDKSSYEIVHKNDDEELTHSNNSLNHLGNHRKRQLSDSEQSCSSKRSPIKNSSSALTSIPNRRQSIGPIEFNIRPGPSDLDATLLEALEASENQNVSLSPTKRSPEIISNILIKPAHQSVPYHNVNDTNTAINSSTFNDLSSTSCDDNNLRINKTNNHPKPGVIDHLNFLKKSLTIKSPTPINTVDKQVITNPSPLPSNIIPIELPILPKDKVVKHLISNSNFLPQTETRPHQHSNLVPNLNYVLPRNTIIRQSIPNSNFFPITATRPHYHANENFVQNIHVNPHIPPKAIVPNMNTVVQQFIPNQSLRYPIANTPSTVLQIAKEASESVAVSNENVSNIDKNNKLPTATSISVSRPIASNISHVESRLLHLNTVAQQFIHNENLRYPIANTTSTVLPIEKRIPECIDVSTKIVPNLDKNYEHPPLQIAPSNSVSRPIVISNVVSMNAAAQKINQNQSLRYPISNPPSTVLPIAKRAPECIGESTGIVPNLDQNDKRPSLQTAPSISVARPIVPIISNVVSMYAAAQKCNQNQSLRYPIVNTPSTVESVGVSTEIVPNLDQNDNRPSLRTTPSISLVPNSIPPSSKPVEITPDPYIFEVDEYLNPIKAISEFKITKVPNPQKSNLQSQSKAISSKQTIPKYSSSKNEHKSSESIGVSSEIVSNLDKTDKASGTTFPIPATSKPVETTPDPYIFEVDEYLNPIRTLSELKILKVSNDQKSNIVSQPKAFVLKETISKNEQEYTCNFCRESFTTVEMRQDHLKACKIKKDIEIPAYVLLENIEHNVDIKRQYHKVFSDLAKNNSNDIIEILDETQEVKIENLVLNLTPTVEIKNSNFPNINYRSNKTDILKQLLAYDKNESPVNQDSQTDLSSESPELDNVISSWKMLPKKDSIHPQNNSMSMEHLKSYIHLYKIPVSIGYKNSFEVNYNFEEPLKRRKTFDDWDDMTPIDIIKSSTTARKQPSTPITESNINVLPPIPGEALVIPIENICQNVLNVSNPCTRTPIPGEALAIPIDNIYQNVPNVSNPSTRTPIPGEALAIPIENICQNVLNVSNPSTRTPIPGEALAIPIENICQNVLNVSNPSTRTPIPGEALAIPIENICQNVLNNSTSQNIHMNSTQIQLRDSVITNTSSNVVNETLPDLGDLELFSNNLVCTEVISPSSDSGTFDSTNSNQSYPHPQQNPVYQQVVTHVQPNVISPGTYQTTVYPSAVGERMNGLETNYFENYMNYQQPQTFRSNKTWYPTQTAMYKDIRRPPPPPYSSHYQTPPGPEKRNVQHALPHPYNHINTYHPRLVNNYYAYDQNSNPNVNIPNRSDYYYNRNFVPDVSNVPPYQMTDNYKDGMQIDSAIMQSSDIANSASTIRVRPLSDLK